MVKNKLIVWVVLLFAMVSCTELESGRTDSLLKPACSGTVVLSARLEPGIRIATRTVSGADGLSTQWSSEDTLALWARNSEGKFVLEARPFTHYGSGFFTSRLPVPMEKGSYTYYAACPLPYSFNGNTVTYIVPSRQNGLSGEGEDIMVAGPVVAEELQPVDWLDAGYARLEMQFGHILHRFRFYTDAYDALDGDSIRRIVVAFPRAVAGTISFNLDDADGTLTSLGTDEVLEIVPESPAAVSDNDVRNYLTASIIPTTFAPGESMKVRFYTDRKVAETSIPLQSRTFAAGHSTPVRLVPQKVGSYCRINLKVLSNNLGEKVQTITLRAPAGCKWSDNGNETKVLSLDGGIDKGSVFLLEYEDEEAFRTLGGKNITATYDSEHVTISQSLSIPDLSGRYSVDLPLEIPYLLYEDFSNVGTFSSNDKYGTSSVGSKDAYSFLDGWSGGRIGAEAGKCVRIACRRETSAGYDARVDSRPLNGRLKKPADLSVEFDYGASNEYGGIALISDPDVGQTFHVGYITTGKNYKSGDKSGTFSVSQYVHEHNGSYDSTPNNFQCVLPSVPSEEIIRISWRSVCEYNAGLTNTTNWLYLDNIKVTISK